jgi:hypothetical protein
MGFPVDVLLQPGRRPSSASVGLPAAAAHENHRTEYNGEYPAD